MCIYRWLDCFGFDLTLVERLKALATKLLLSSFSSEGDLFLDIAGIKWALAMLMQELD